MIKIEQIAHHRNGIDGESFHAILFTCPEYGRMVATVFDGPGRVSVLNRDMLVGEANTVQFGVNSWRGDHYEAELRAAIAAVEHNPGS